jgi:hypothetical protein
MMKKMLFALAVLAFVATPAMAGNQPEYDVVGCDATNFFNDFIKVAVCENGLVPPFTPGVSPLLNEWSDFQMNDPSMAFEGNEQFNTTAGQLWPDPCFNELKDGCSYDSALTDPWNEGLYEWVIVLQKKPESDLDLNIRDCVLKHNLWNVWTDVEQTGRYRAPWGQLFFVPTANPTVTVKAYPGEYATPGFDYVVDPDGIVVTDDSFHLDAREMPGLALAALQDAVYTSKAIWEESLVIKLPATGGLNAVGETEYNLHQGDIIWIQVAIPGNNTVDIRYGEDNVSLKYIGIVGTEYIADANCGVCGECI